MLLQERQRVLQVVGDHGAAAGDQPGEDEAKRDDAAIQYRAGGDGNKEGEAVKNGSLEHPKEALHVL
ncbi:hypothetical protein GMPD_29290 [Geomonas paludis]|uniref:Uncharacterized protein n=1 Tax=Geomonas paludis TaxID=2740185 RepID=A0A6V8MY55_9BACT|nr:hypothetical protein GMPD_29290 [Geomonas paludis]